MRMTTPLTASPEVWTISIVLRSDTNQTRADAFLQGPPVELESCASAPTPTGPQATCEHNLAAAEALWCLSRQLRARASQQGPTAHH
jgi:hypothetical protein